MLKVVAKEFRAGIMENDLNEWRARLPENVGVIVREEVNSAPYGSGSSLMHVLICWCDDTQKVTPQTQ